MQQPPLKAMQPRNRRPLPFVKQPGPRHEDIGSILKRIPRVQVEHLHEPPTHGIIPPGTNAPLLESDMPPNIILQGNSLPILQNLIRAGEEMRPTRPGFVTELVRM